MGKLLKGLPENASTEYVSAVYMPGKLSPLLATALAHPIQYSFYGFDLH
jgi:hypothetical protein